MLVRYKKNGRQHLYDTLNIPIQIQAAEELTTKPFESCGNCNYASHGFFVMRKKVIA